MIENTSEPVILKSYEKNGYLDRVIKYLDEKHPYLQSQFQNHLEKAQFEITGRVVSSIIKENLVKVIEINGYPFILKDILDSKLPIDYNFNTNKVNVIKLLCKNEKKSCNLFIKVKSISKLHIISFYDYPSIGEQSNKITNPIKILDLVRKYGDGNVKSIEDFKKKIENSIANLALTNLLTMEKRKKIESTSMDNNFKDLLEYSDYNLKNDTKFDEYLFYEQLSSRGHPFLPTFKQRYGFSPEDVVNYAPEFSSHFYLKFIAIHKSICQVHSYNDANEEIFSSFSKFNLREKIIEHFKIENLNISDYQVTMVHPFQFDNFVKEIYKDEISNKKVIIIPFGEDFVKYTAGLSTRTVFPVENGNNEKNMSCFKSSLSIYLTSHFRTMGLKSLENQFEIDKILKKIIQIEPQYFKNSSFLHFISSIGFISENSHKGTYINALFRENPNKYSKCGHHLILGATLFEKSPITKKYVYYEIIKRYQTSCGIEVPSSHLKWFKKYVLTITKPYLFLYFKYGIALEPHLQNTICSVNSKTGEIDQIIYRDWDGIAALKERFEQHLHLYKDTTFNKFTDIDDYRKRINHSFLTINLGELVVKFSKDFNITEDLLWKEIKKVFKEIIGEIKNDPQNSHIKNDIENEENLFFNTPHIVGAAFTKSDITSHSLNCSVDDWFYNNPFFNN